MTVALAPAGLACSDSSTPDAAAETAPSATRAPSPLGELDLPPLEFTPVDDQGTVATEITSEALFDLDSAELKPDAEAIVEQLAQRLAAEPASVRVDGYTDGLGDEAHNLQLSQARADSLATRIRSLGTATGVLACGRGEEGTDGTSDDPAARRVVVTLSSRPTPPTCE